MLWFGLGKKEDGTPIGADKIGTIMLNMAVFGAMFSYILQAVSFILLRVYQPNINRPYVSPLGIPGAVVTIVIACVTLLYQIQDKNFSKGVLWVVVWFAVGDQERPGPVVGDAVFAVAGLAVLNHVERFVNRLAHRRIAFAGEGGRLEFVGGDEVGLAIHVAPERDDGHLHAFRSQRIGKQFEIDVRSERTLRISRETLPSTPTVIILDGV